LADYTPTPSKTPPSLSQFDGHKNKYVLPGSPVRSIAESWHEICCNSLYGNLFGGINAAF